MTKIILDDYLHPVRELVSLGELGGLTELDPLASVVVSTGESKLFPISVPLFSATWTNREVDEVSARCSIDLCDWDAETLPGDL